MSKLPDFVIIGAQKSASSFMQLCLADHPDIYIPEGETPFFESPDYEQGDIHEIEELFEGRSEKCLGIKRPNYIGKAEVPNRILKHLPNAKLIAILRNPSAWSAAFAAEIAIISNFVMNNFWTFRTARIVKPFKFLFKLFQFNMTSFGAVFIQFAVIGFATLIFGDTPLVRKISLVIAVVFFIVPYNWIVYNKIIWRIKARRMALRE